MRVPAWIVVTASIVVLAGCRHYERRPVDLNDHLQAWDRRLAEAVERSDPAVAGSRPRMSLDLALELGSVYAPELRALRVALELPAARVDNPVRMADPTLEFEYARALESARHPNNFAPKIGFEIPTSGSLEVQRQADEAELSAARLEFDATAWEWRHSLRASWYAWSGARREVALLTQYIDEFQQILDETRNLVEAGEIDSIAQRLLEVEVTERRIDLEIARQVVMAARLEVLTVAGLPPDAAVDLVPELAPVEVPPGLFGDGAVSRAAVVARRHPAVRWRLDEFTLADERYRLEIHKQYPDLAFGTGYDYDDGQSRINFGFGLPIPVWNGNRRGIAEALARRELARVTAETELEQRAADLERARLQLLQMRSTREAVEQQLLPLARRQLEETRALLSIGEIDALLIREALSGSLDARRRLLSALVAEATAASDLAGFGGALELDETTTRSRIEEVDR